MPNSYVTLIEQESSDCTTAVLRDITDWTSPLRNTRALFVKLVKRDASDPANDTPITIDNGLPLTAYFWNFNLIAGYKGDGWHVATLFIYPLWSAGTYNTNNCVYHSDSGKYYRAKSDGVVAQPPNVLYWEELTDPTSIAALANTNVDVIETHNFTTCKAEIPVGDALESLADQIIDGVPKDWEDAGNSLIGLALLNGAWVKHYRVKNQAAQEIIDFVNQKFPARL